jgi:hypothetical protein
MGGNESQEARVDPNFKMQRYLNQGLNQQQILMVREIFESYHPQNGLISADTYRESLLRAQTNGEVIERLGDKQALTFDDFFAVEKEVIVAHLAKFPGAEVDSTQVPPPSNFFCPYAQEVVRN